MSAIFSDVSVAQCICIGSGRFLRCVLVPAMGQIKVKCVIAQARSTYVFDMLKARGDGTFEVDVVCGGDKGVRTDIVGGISAAYSLSDADGRKEFMNLPKVMRSVKYIGLGVTEAGVARGSPAIEDLSELLHACALQEHTVCVICTDNVGHVGDRLRDLVSNSAYTKGLLGEDATLFSAYLSSFVSFPNTMVDRVTSHRAGDACVPRTEILPKKALVLEDTRSEGGGVPVEIEGCPGCIVRRKEGELDVDFALKIRIANGTHTAMVYAMALSGKHFTSHLADLPTVKSYLDRLFASDILPGLSSSSAPPGEAQAVYQEWMHRLTFPMEHSTFFVCQNAIPKIMERLMPTVESNSIAKEKGQKAASPFMAFAVAAILRFLTPRDGCLSSGGGDVFEGLMDSPPDSIVANPDGHEYTTGLRFFDDGRYTFRVPPPHNGVPMALKGLLGDAGGGGGDAKQRAISALAVVAADGGDADQQLVEDAANLYAKMVGDGREKVMSVLEGLLSGEA